MDVGIEFGHYKVIEHIGRGGMADVWSARDKRLNRTVAIKTIARNLSSDIDPIKMFEREAKTIARLEHPHILPIYEFGEYQGQLYIVMRYISGGSLEDLLEGGALDIDDALRLARPIAQALDYAHTNKVIHLDLKPSNILLDSYGSPYLADFGLATVLGPEGRADNPGSGTLLYMAPEQMTENVLDLRADVYSYSILMFHMMTGSLPFDGSMPLSIKQLQANGELPDISAIRSDIPAKVTEVLRLATALDIERRSQSILDVYTALEAAAQGVGVRSVQPLMPRSRADMSTAQLGANVGDMTTSLDPLNKQAQDTPTADYNANDLKTLVDFDADELLGDADYLNTAHIQNLDTMADVRLPAAHENAATVQLGDALPLAGIKGDATAKLPPPPKAPTKAESIKLPEGTDPLARREAEVIYAKARRIWANGQGKFLLGITHLMLINDFYSHADAYFLELDEAGTQMLLRGALEYDHEIDFWWAKLNDENRRWVALHAVRSENPLARIRALEKLTDLADKDGQIPKAIAQAITVEQHAPAKRVALRVLKSRGKLESVDTGWRDVVFSREIDRLIAQSALERDDAETAALAARSIGQIRSRAAVELIAEHQRKGERGALKALALVRDEAPSLPHEVSASARLYAWLANTWRRLVDDPLALMSRFLVAAFFGWMAMALYVWTSIPDVGLIDPDRYGLTISVGLTFGVIVGFQVLFASELPSRLRGFWHWWGRGIASLILGFALGTLSWAAFTWFFLRYPPESNLYLVGAGTAIGFAIPVIFRLPTLLNVLITALGIGIPLYIAWDQYLPPILYFSETQSVIAVLSAMMLLIGIGAYARQLLRGLMGVFRR